jgi:hypothetical protein
VHVLFWNERFVSLHRAHEGVAEERGSPQKVATGPRIVFVASIITTVAFAPITHHALPHEALLPATVTLIFVLAAAVALFASRNRVPTRQFTCWDAGSLLAGIGIMAGHGGARRLGPSRRRGIAATRLSAGRH